MRSLILPSANSLATRIAFRMALALTAVANDADAIQPEQAGRRRTRSSPRAS